MFELSPSDWKSVKTLYHFTGGSDGAYPDAGVIVDNKGNFYGAASEGGSGGCGGGCGTIFELTKGGKLSVLHDFQDGSDGSDPVSAPIMDKSGDVYGTAYWGGTWNYGTIFEISKY